MKLSKPWKITLGIVAGALLAICLAFAIGVRYASRHAQEVVMRSLHNQFHADVQLDSVQMKMYPSIQVSGAGLRMYAEGREDLPPLISIKSFTAQAHWLGLIRFPHHISHVTLVGLEITVPTGQPGDDEQPRSGNLLARVNGALLDDVQTDNAKVTVMPKQADKQPEVVDIATLRAHSVSGDGKMAAEAVLRSAVPPGIILSSGTFGPWDGDVPARTPVSGSFSFKNADLSTVPGGAAGILSLEGHYDGVIEKISADGTAEVPNFSTNTSEHPVDLTATFHVIVDGANEATVLQPLDVHFLRTTLHATGIVAGTPGQQGKAVSLDLSATDARIEDILVLTVKDQPAMTGNVRLHTTLLLPAGPQNDPMNQIVLNGAFDVDQVVFTDHAAEQKVNTLSMRSQGQTGDVPDDNVASEMHGKFNVQNGVMTFSDLRFDVPGAQVQMVGTFGLAHQTFDMRGTLDMDVAVSQTTTGVKSFLLKAVNPLFAKPGGGSRIYFKMLGTEKVPIYLLDLHHKTPEKTQNQDAGKNNTADARAN
jgi:hypothetical protein